MARQTPIQQPWWREPLFVFALLGAATFALNGWLGPAASSGPLVVDQGTVQRLIADFERRQGRAPNERERAELIDRWIDEQLLYEEGLDLGLDRSDPLVRRRIIQQARFLQEELAPPPEPSDQQLDAWTARHADELRLPLRLAIEQVFSRDGAPESRLRALGAALSAQGDGDGLGDPFPRGARFSARPLTDYAEIFGPEFATRLGALPAAADPSWRRIRSRYGEHFVRVTRRDLPRAPEPSELRARAELALRQEAQAANVAAALKRLRDQRGVVVERP